MAPMAGGIADRQLDGYVASLFLRECRWYRGPPISGIVRMLVKIGTGPAGESVHCVAHPEKTDTIYALSSGSVPSGVAIVRLSGPETARLLASLCGPLPDARRASLRTLRRPVDSEVI